MNFRILELNARLLEQFEQLEQYCSRILEHFDGLGNKKVVSNKSVANFSTSILV